MSEGTPDLDRLQALDDREWSEVERLFGGRLYAYVARRVPDLQAREDVLQECFLGAVRGIGGFDRIYTLEQYLFGICRNRTIDYLRRRRDTTLADGPEGSEDGGDPMQRMAVEELTPSAIVGGADLRARARELLVEVLREWVQLTWAAGEFRRLMVIEALFYGGWRNRDTWKHFGLPGETAVAGIKFRALARMRELAGRGPDNRELMAALAEDVESVGGQGSLDVAQVWAAAHASCPARHWLARHQAGTLEEGPLSFVKFHLSDMECPWCLANHDDLAQDRVAPEPLIERVHASTMNYLRSRTQR